MSISQDGYMVLVECLISPILLVFEGSIPEKSNVSMCYPYSNSPPWTQVRSYRHVWFQAIYGLYYVWLRGFGWTSQMFESLKDSHDFCRTNTCLGLLSPIFWCWKSWKSSSSTPRNPKVAKMNATSLRHWGTTMAWCTMTWCGLVLRCGAWCARGWKRGARCARCIVWRLQLVCWIIICLEMARFLGTVWYGIPNLKKKALMFDVNP